MSTHQKQVLKSIHYRVDRQHRFPVLAQDVQADISLQIDVRMVHLRLAFHLWRLVWIVGAHLEVRVKLQLDLVWIQLAFVFSL